MAMILDLLHTYAAWLCVSALYLWLGSVLYRTMRNTLNAHAEYAHELETPAPAPVHIPPYTSRKPRIPLSNAA